MDGSVRDIILPFREPIQGQDGNKTSELSVPADTFVGINCQGSNRNAARWGDDTERWMAPLPAVLERARVPGIAPHL